MTSATSDLLDALDTFLSRVCKSDADTLKAALEQAARNAEGEVRAAALAAARMLGDGIASPDVRAALEAGDLEAAVQALDWDTYERELLVGITLALAAAYLVTLRTSAATYGGPDGTEAAALTLARAAALEWAEQRAGAAVAEISAGTRAAIRTTIARVIREGLSVEDAAAALRPVVGLTEAQAVALEAERVRLAAEAALSLAEQRAAAEAYARELVAARAQAIAETESWAAATAGEMESWTLLDGLGLLGEDLVMVWVAQADACDECLELDGEEAAIGRAFKAGGLFDGPPLHPNCRCELELRPASGD